MPAIVASRSELDGARDRDKSLVHVEGGVSWLDSNQIEGSARPVPRGDFSQEVLVCFFNAPNGANARWTARCEVKMDQ